ncbi:MAG TPA: ribbon-helix-helix protein, CopG family [Vicinamibacterales bacterium]|nr:ribbon-helix-helix protein, CopG family [Vicinamibacterales bacterium]
MKAVQVLFDDALLARLDADDEVQKDGRSAVLRRAATEYLRRRRARKTAEAYRRAYGKRGGVEKELQGWPAEGAWPEN